MEKISKKKRKSYRKIKKQFNKHGIRIERERPPRKRYFPGEKVKEG